jgi:uncharacterized protein (TIGR03085 family)
VTVAKDERRDLAALLLAVGPDAPTMCAGWLTLDLAAHLVIREHRVDAQAGILLPPLAGWTERVREGATFEPYVDLVERVRTGPPRWSPLAFSPLDEATNTLEYLVHHEDVRRAQPGWAPRVLATARLDEVWRRGVRVARLALRRAPVGVALARPGAAPVVVRRGSPMVTVRGEPVEVVLWSFGRTSVADVTFEGDPDAVAALKAFRPSV